MELSNEFTVGVPVGEAWKVLTDVERIAPCLPGTELQDVEAEEYRGRQDQGRPDHRALPMTPAVEPTIDRQNSSRRAARRNRGTVCQACRVSTCR